MFLIVLSDSDLADALAAGSPATYLTHTLRPQGELLPNYYAVTHGALADGIALVSGQGPNPQTVADCPVFTPMQPGSVGAAGQALGSGCVFDPSVHTVADQLTSNGLSWKAYVQGIGTATCPAPPIGGADPHQTPDPAGAYVSWRNPFLYFGSLAAAGQCAQHDVDLGRLGSDLRAPGTTPSFSYIVPDRCHDASDTVCTPGQPSGLAAADGFLSTVVPEIMRSDAFRTGGMIAITFDQGPASDSSACCQSTAFPNMPPQAATAGGGRVGLLLLSPFVKAGSVDSTDSYNHFSLLRSVEALLGLPYLGYAADPALPTLDHAVFNAARYQFVHAKVTPASHDVRARARHP